MPVERFLKVHWGKKPLIISRKHRGIYASLPKVKEYGILLGSLPAGGDGWFSLVKERAQAAPKSMLTKDGTLNMAEVYQALGDGYSLLLTKMHRRHEAIGRLCATLEAELSARGIVLARPIGANGYLTPRSAQGFGKHYDDHDVFILQLEGSKTWRIFGQTVRAPHEPPSAPLTEDEVGKPTFEVTLSPGDLVYMPRGVAHEAWTVGGRSLHLTLGVYPATWRDMLVELLGADECFRANLPRGFARNGKLRRADRRALEMLAARLPGSAFGPVVAAKIANRLLAESDLRGVDRLEAVIGGRRVTSDDTIRIADGVRSAVEVDGASAFLHLPGMTMKADRAFERAFRLIAKGKGFRIGDLPIAMDADAKVTFVDDLLLGGYLVKEK